MVKNSPDSKIRQRHTAQRELLLKVLSETKEHLDADKLYRKARQRQPSLSLSTVYRNLELFKRLGLVEDHQLDGMRRHYEAKAKTRHHHLVCLGCGRILEFSCPSTGRMKSRIAKAEGFKVIDIEVRLLGYCPECQVSRLDPQKAP